MEKPKKVNWGDDPKADKLQRAIYKENQFIMLDISTWIQIGKKRGYFDYVKKHNIKTTK